MTWEILLGIITLVGFLISIIGPVMKLTKTMAELTISVTNLREDINQINIKNSESHKQIRNNLEVQDKRLDNHEKRLIKIEYDIDKFHGNGQHKPHNHNQ